MRGVGGGGGGGEGQIISLLEQISFQKGNGVEKSKQEVIKSFLHCYKW